MRLLSDPKAFIGDKFRVLTEEKEHYVKEDMQLDEECSRQVVALVSNVFDKVFQALETVSVSYVKQLKAAGRGIVTNINQL